MKSVTFQTFQTKSNSDYVLECMIVLVQDFDAYVEFVIFVQYGVRYRELQPVVLCFIHISPISNQLPLFSLGMLSCSLSVKLVIFPAYSPTAHTPRQEKHT